MRKIMDNGQGIIDNGQLTMDNSELPKGWEIKNFEDSLEKVVYTNKIKRKKFLVNGKYPIVSQEHNLINGYWDNSDDLFKIKKPVVIFGDHTKIVKYINFDFVLGADGVKILQPKKEIDSKYFYYYLLNFDLGNLGYARHYRLLKKIEIHYPKSLKEQKRIVSILDRAFEAIDKAKANAEQNLKNAKELFESYLQGVFENKGDDWKELSIKNLTELVTKGSSPKWQGINYVGKGGVFFLTSKNVGEGILLLDNKKYLEKKFNDIQKTSILKKGDVLTNIVGASIGRTAIFDLDEITNINQAVCLMRCLPEKIYNYYLMFLLNSPFFKNILHDNEVNNARANLSLTFFKNLVIPLPTLSEQQEIVEKIKLFSAKTKKLESIYQQKINDLEELKKSILQKAFAGELTEKEIAL